MPLVFQTITSRIPYVVSKIGNRSDVDVTPFIRDAYIDIAMNYDFEELLTTTTSLTSVSSPTNILDTYDYPDGVRAIKSLTLIDSTFIPFPLQKRPLSIIEQYPNATPTRPVIYCSFTSGTNPNIKRVVILRGAPDQVYTLRWRVWMKPVIVANPNLGTTLLQVPDDWLEIIDYAAAMRCFYDSLLEPDRGNAIFQLLFGRMDMKSGKREPGLIAQRVTASQYEYDDSFGMRPGVRPMVQRR